MILQLSRNGLCCPTEWPTINPFPKWMLKSQTEPRTRIPPLLFPSFTSLPHFLFSSHNLFITQKMQQLSIQQQKKKKKNKRNIQPPTKHPAMKVEEHSRFCINALLFYFTSCNTHYFNSFRFFVDSDARVHDKVKNNGALHCVQRATHLIIITVIVIASIQRNA